MTVLLTGCAGFIGSHLLDRLLVTGHRVIGVDDFNDYYSPKQKRININRHLDHPLFQLIKKDIRNLNFKDLHLPITRRRPTITIIHLAARAGVRASIKEPLLYQEVNVGGTLRLLELSRKLKVKQFIFGSSSSVYGESKEIPFQENNPCDQPISPYAATKRSAELLCSTYHRLYRIPTTILRFFTVYGPRNRPDMAAYKFTDRIARGKPIEVYGRKTARDYTYVGDIVEGITAALELKSPQFEIINLGNSSPVSLPRFIAAIEQTVSKKAKIQWKPLPPGDVTRTFADISRAQKLLSWKPKTPLKAGLTNLWKWYQNQAQ